VELEVRLVSEGLEAVDGEGFEIHGGQERLKPIMKRYPPEPRQARRLFFTLSWGWLRCPKQDVGFFKPRLV
jgi:hypothetical protein